MGGAIQLCACIADVINPVTLGISIVRGTTMLSLRSESVNLNLEPTSHVSVSKSLSPSVPLTFFVQSKEH